MDLNEYTKIQCFNCHADIPPPETPPQLLQEQQSVCEVCLNQQSTIIAAMQMQIEVLEKESSALRCSYQKEGQFYLSLSGDCSQEEIKKLEAELSALEQESLELVSEEQAMNQQTLLLFDHYDQMRREMDYESNLLCGEGFTLEKEVEKEIITNEQTTALETRLRCLQKLHMLPELYSIHFDDKQAFVNQQPLTFKTAPLLLEIVSLLADKHHYQGFKVNFCDRVLETSQNSIKISTEREQATIPWLIFIVKEIVFLWEHIKQQTAITTHQSCQAYSLPFKVSLQPEVTINRLFLQAGPEYCTILKYLTHNIKTMMNLDAMGESVSDNS